MAFVFFFVFEVNGKCDALKCNISLVEKTEKFFIWREILSVSHVAVKDQMVLESSLWITYLALDKMAAIPQTIYSYAFS